MSIPVTVAYGDGIGPEILTAVLRVLEAADAGVRPEVIEVGEKLYAQGFSSGIRPEDWDVIRRNRAFLKAPITTPTGGGVKSLNVTLRKTLGLYANVRPVLSFHPFVRTRHPAMNVVIVRENEEDLYAGIEHRQTQEVTQCLKLISRPGCERINRYAFEYARQFGRQHVTCFVKDNIMKVTDGLFARVFAETAAEYPDLRSSRMIIDIGTALLADHPERFDVIVTPNLYGDILSDVAAQIAGSVGLAGSANLGDHHAMFEAVHGSAPDIAGQDVANPSGLLKAAIMMLVHLGLAEPANRIRDAWLATIEDGIHTRDVFDPEGGHSRELVGTQAFADAVIARLGRTPRVLPAAAYRTLQARPAPAAALPKAHKELVGIDLFFDWDEAGRDADALAARLLPLAGDGLSLRMITNRGVKVWPDGFPETFRTDHWRCRFQADGLVPHRAVAELFRRAVDAGLDLIKTEHLYTFDGEPGFALGQGQ